VVDWDLYIFFEKSSNIVSSPQGKGFDKYIIRQLGGKLDPSIALDINHFQSKDNKGIQVADMFCWGFFWEI